MNVTISMARPISSLYLFGIGRAWFRSAHQRGPIQAAFKDRRRAIPSAYRVIFANDFDVNYLKSLTLGPDEFCASYASSPKRRT